MATKVDIKDLLEAGVHFGHKTSRWHPKMAPFIHSKRGEAHVIDLNKTVEALEIALEYATKTTAGGKQILLVGTKRQAKEIVEKAAEETSQPFVTQRWMGGMLTNKATMGKRIKHLKKLEEKMASGELESKFNKLEVQRFQEEIEEMNYIFGGIKDMRGMPAATIVFDVVNDHIAVKEAKILGIKVIGIVDTNADPTGIDFPIPANDDAIKGLQLLADYFVSAINEGRGKAKIVKEENEAKAAKVAQAAKEAKEKVAKAKEAKEKEEKEAKAKAAAADKKEK